MNGRLLIHALPSGQPVPDGKWAFRLSQDDQVTALWESGKKTDWQPGCRIFAFSTDEDSCIFGFRNIGSLKTESGDVLPFGFSGSFSFRYFSAIGLARLLSGMKQSVATEELMMKNMLSPAVKDIIGETVRRLLGDMPPRSEILQKKGQLAVQLENDLFNKLLYYGVLLTRHSLVIRRFSETVECDELSV